VWLALIRIRRSAYPVRLPPATTSFSQNAVSDLSDIPKYIHANCQVCGTRVTPKATNAGRRLKCPDCETLIQLPTMEQFLEIRREQALSEPRQPEPAEPYAMRERVERAEATVSVFRELAQIKREEAPPPPQYTFFSNVFEFPWKTTDALSRWALVAAGFTVSGLFLVLNVTLVERYGFAALVGVIFFVLFQIVVTVWTAACAASLLMSILQDTAAGLDRIESWPDGGWRDWMSDLTMVGYLFFVSGFVSLAPARLLQPVIEFQSAIVLAIHAALFPVTLLAGFDAESIWLPWSKTILRSLRIIPRDWLLFYSLTLVLVGVGDGFLLACMIGSPWLFGFMLGPVLASQIFIGARLLGRLAWRIGETALIDEDDDDD
jgi:hypothetical protein